MKGKKKCAYIFLYTVSYHFQMPPRLTERRSNRRAEANDLERVLKENRIRYWYGFFCKDIIDSSLRRCDVSLPFSFRFVAVFIFLDILPRTRWHICRTSRRCNLKQTLVCFFFRISSTAA